MTTAADDFLIEVKTFVVALEAEGMKDAAKVLGLAVRRYEKAAPRAWDHEPDWTLIERQLEARAKAMHEENAALTPQQRSTAFGVMTGTATIVLSALADAIRCGRGEPPDQRVEQMVAVLRADRTQQMLDRARAGAPK